MLSIKSKFKSITFNGEDMCVEEISSNKASNNENTTITENHKKDEDIRKVIYASLGHLEEISFKISAILGSILIVIIIVYDLYWKNDFLMILILILGFIVSIFAFIFLIKFILRVDFRLIFSYKK